MNDRSWRTASLLASLSFAASSASSFTRFNRVRAVETSPRSNRRSTRSSRNGSRRGTSRAAVWSSASTRALAAAALPPGVELVGPLGRVRAEPVGQPEQVLAAGLPGGRAELVPLDHRLDQPVRLVLRLGGVLLVDQEGGEPQVDVRVGRLGLGD